MWIFFNLNQCLNIFIYELRTMRMWMFSHIKPLLAAHYYTIMLFLLFHVMRELEQGGGFRPSVLLHIFSYCAHLPPIDDHII